MNNFKDMAVKQLHETLAAKTVHLKNTVQEYNNLVEAVQVNNKLLLTNAEEIDKTKDEIKVIENEIKSRQEIAEVNNDYEGRVAALKKERNQLNEMIIKTTEELKSISEKSNYHVSTFYIKEMLASINNRKKQINAAIKKIRTLQAESNSTASNKSNGGDKVKKHLDTLLRKKQKQLIDFLECDCNSDPDDRIDEQAQLDVMPVNVIIFSKYGL